MNNEPKQTAWQKGRLPMKNSALSIMFVAMAALGCEESFSLQSYEFALPVTLVSLDTDFGDVVVEAVESESSTHVSVDIECQASLPGYDVYVEDGTLVVDLDAGSGASACEGTIKILVPANAALDINTGRGDVSVSGTTETIEIVTYEGDVKLSDIQGDFDVTAVSGNVECVNLGSLKSRLTVGTGDADLTYLAKPEVVDVDILMGNVNLVVPSEEYAVDATTESGQIDLSGISTDDNSDRELLLSTDSGNIVVLGK
jgi:hypothetical protein